MLLQMQAREAQHTQMETHTHTYTHTSELVCTHAVHTTLATSLLIHIGTVHTTHKKGFAFMHTAGNTNTDVVS